MYKLTKWVSMCVDCANVFFLFKSGMEYCVDKFVVIRSQIGLNDHGLKFNQTHLQFQCKEERG